MAHSDGTDGFGGVGLGSPELPASEIGHAVIEIPHDDADREILLEHVDGIPRIVVHDPGPTVPADVVPLAYAAYGASASQRERTDPPVA